MREELARFLAPLSAGERAVDRADMIPALINDADSQGFGKALAALAPPRNVSAGSDTFVVAS